MNYFKNIVIFKIFSIILTFNLFNSPSYGLPADDVIPLVDGDYYPQVHQALITARKSIMCVMYMADINPKYNKGWEYNLVNDLIGAHRRGVDVLVIFDQNTMFWEEGKKGKKTERRSQEAYDLLKKNGVPVYYDSKDRITHNKILVIDNYITIVGSTNWTYSALRKNHEASVLIKSRSVAESFLNKLRTISKYQPK
ncbi:MAG TPA: phospholipase D-like domain-containing protein [Candidatus Wujingus californicus]|uniref:phospholipase D-like domain-containing protein n=1 Tax=Candidatus Wujingus californicus TaxID=3367618 RepID=UPI004024FE0D